MAAKYHSQEVVVVAVPFPAQGHLNQLLHLSLLLLTTTNHSHNNNNIHLHFVGSHTHNRQAQLRLHAGVWNNSIHFHDFQTPPFPSPPPNPNSSSKFPSHLHPSFESSLHLRHPVKALLTTLSSTSRRVVVIHDSLMSSVVQDVASIPNAESYTLHTVSAFTMFFYLWEAMGRPFPVPPPQLGLLDHLPSLEGCFTPEFTEFITAQHDHMKIHSGRLYNTSKVLEAPFLDLLAKEEISGNKKQWAMGPFNPVAIPHNEQYPRPIHRCLEWLDNQDPDSVIFVSFGTTTSLSDEQIKETAIGLERSNHKFIWVLRDADRGDVFKEEANSKRLLELPKGYEERTREKGMVVRDWAPQLEILGHRSTGGFMSHCGWNSCMESISMGVPIAAWPMHSDQPRNSVLVTKLLQVGIVVKDWSKRDELVTSSMVEEAVKKLMNSKEGDEIRERTSELGGAVRQSMEEGGTSRRELDCFIAHITR